MDQEIASVINTAHFHQQAPTYNRIMNARRNVKGAITAMTHQNTTAAMAMRYCDVIIMAARTLHRGVMNVEENETWERLNIHALPLVRYMGKAQKACRRCERNLKRRTRAYQSPASYDG